MRQNTIIWFANLVAGLRPRLGQKVQYPTQKGQGIDWRV